MNPTVSYLNDLKSNVISKGDYLKESSYFNENSKRGNQKEEFLAEIFAIYAIIRATSNTSQTKRRVNIKFRPHEIQVTTILLILGIVNSKDEKLRNRIAEVGTGEGKSIVLAMTSLYLALVGFDVKIACYSPYLS